MQVAQMSEYQRYEWMTSDRPLTRAQLEAVNALSSHIDATSTRAVVEYHWSNFRHDPLRVLHDFFDGFLYWTNWGAPELALRFPHGNLPRDLLDGYDLDGFVTFRQAPDYDILDVHFGELEAPNEWVEYELGSLIALREELMDDDVRALYIIWLASECLWGRPDDDQEYDSQAYRDDEDDVEDAGEDEDEDEDELEVPPIPPGLSTLTSAQQALAELLQVPQELLVAAAQHSIEAMASTHAEEDVAAWVALLPPERRTAYLVRLARNEPSLSRMLLKELRALSHGSHHQTSAESQEKDQGPDRRGPIPSTGERVPFAVLRAESRSIREQWERERREQERLARERHLQQIHEQQDAYWQRADLAVARGSGSGYDEAALVLGELREVAARFQETTAFEARFRAWIQPHLHRPAFVKRLQERRFPLPQA
jgi:hypothetical protein